MNKDIKVRWVKALRSGKYKQAKNWLKNGDTFCCLGVLTDLYLKERKKGWEAIRVSHENEACPLWQHRMLPPAVQKWAGLNHYSPVVSDRLGEHCSLSIANDSREYNFDYIANLIEKSL